MKQGACYANNWMKEFLKSETCVKNVEYLLGVIPNVLFRQGLGSEERKGAETEVLQTATANR